MANEEPSSGAGVTKPEHPDLGSLWSLVIAFLTAEGATVFYSEGPTHSYTICAWCKRCTRLLRYHDASPPSKISIFYSCKDCNQCRVLQVVSTSWQGFCQEPNQCAYCLDFKPLSSCKLCVQMRKDVREGRVTW